MKKFVIAVLIILGGIAAGIYYYQSRPEAIPKPQPHTANPTPTNNSQLPEEVNLAVPFTSQAPFMNWEEPYQNFCEEASALMATSYLKGKTDLSPEEADKQMLEIKKFEEEKFGDYLDTTAAQTQTILQEFLEVKDAELVENPTLDQIKHYLASGKIVLLPANGKALPNPNFRSGGPVYHMLVIKGYTKTGKIITNDPGTRKGADFLYDPQSLMDAMHDWNGGDVKHGKKVVLVVG